jgi:formylmethanofuran dehydrogenase subunit A
MSEPITLKQQVAFIQGTLDTHEQVCGVKVEMGRMTKADAQRRTEKLKAVLATLKKAEAAGGVAESALKEMTPAGTEFTKASVMSEVHKCAKRNAPDCQHCASIANILDEITATHDRH